MSKIISSADITLLDFSVLLDLSTSVPTCSITNLSTVIHADKLKWVFEFTSPYGTTIHTADFDTPDINGTAFTTHLFTEQIPLTFGQMEYGQNPYTVKVSVKDEAGVISFLTKGASLCKPNGNVKGNFGKADIDIQVKCGTGQLFVTDKTNLIYKSIVGTKVSTVVELTYPLDNAGNELTPVTINSIPALLPLKYEGEGHEIYVAHVYSYDMGDNFNVRIRYSYQKFFPVYCNVNLEPLLCEVSRITDILARDCFDTAESREKQKKLGLANAKLIKAVVGILQPLSGFDVPKIVEEVKEILEIQCDCCRPAGISNVGAALLTDAVLTVNKICGDAVMSFTNDGNGNIVLTYQDKSYTFDVSGSDAFTWVPSTNACTKDNVLTVDMEILTEEILSNIESNSTLLNILAGLTQKAQMVCSTLDGGDAIDFDECDYGLVIDTTVTGKTFDSVLIDAVSYPAPTGTLAIDAGAIGTFLNSLDKGAFTVSYSSGTNKTTISVTTGAKISTATTSAAGTSTVVIFNSSCGAICTILQKILDYLNDLGFTKIFTGIGLTICRFNTFTGAVESTSFGTDSNAGDVVKFMADSFCNIVNYIKDKLISCANLKALFAAHTDVTGNPNGADVVLGLQAGKCQQIPVRNLALSVFQLLGTDSDVKSMYCMYAKCTEVSDCGPVSSLSGSGTDTTWTYNWNTVVGAIGYKWSIDGTNYTMVTSTSTIITGLTPDTSYTFRVKPVYNSGDGNPCEVTANFVTTDTGAICDNPDDLTLNNVTSTSFMATWASLTGATGYQYRVNGGGWVNAGLVETVNVTGLLPSTVYNFEVRAIIGGNPCSETSSSSVTTDSTNFWELSYTNNDPSVSFQVMLGNNNSSPSIEIYNGTYSEDPISGTSGNLPAVDAIVQVITDIAGMTIINGTCNGVTGTLSIDATSISWNHVNGPLYLSITTTTPSP